MSTALARQQRQFAAAITEAGYASDAEVLLRPTPQGAAPRLDIYRNAYRGRLAAALEENYPVLHRVLGSAAFRDLAGAFIAAHPSRRPSIRWYGDELAGFLAADPEAVPHPALVDLARMEWALGCAFDAADAPSLHADELLAVSAEVWPTLRFVAHPAVRMLRLSWAVEPLWTALSRDAEASCDAPVALEHYLLVWRGADTTLWRSVADDEADLLMACLEGRPFAELCASATLADMAEDDTAAARAAGYLRVWVDAGLLSWVER